MAKQLTEQELRQQAVRALSDSLGPVDALRFLALVSREPFDYQQWRKEYFSHYSVDELLGEIRNHPSEKNRKPMRRPSPVAPWELRIGSLRHCEIISMFREFSKRRSVLDKRAGVIVDRPGWKKSAIGNRVYVGCSAIPLCINSCCTWRRAGH